MIDDKLTAVEDRINSVYKKFEVMEEKVERVEKQIEENVAKAMEKQMERVKIDIDCFKKTRVILENYIEKSKFQPSPLRSSIKLSTLDGKTSGNVYETQFAIVADANVWDSKTKACHLATSLRADATDVLQTLPENRLLDFQALTSALKLWSGEKCLADHSRLQLKSRQQKSIETLQVLATDIERLSHLAFSDCPVEIRENLAVQYFIEGVRDPEIQKALRIADIQDLKGSLVYAMKYEAAQQVTRKDRHSVRAANILDTSNAAFELLEQKVKTC